MLNFVEQNPMAATLAVVVLAALGAMLYLNAARKRDRRALRALEERIRRDGEKQAQTILAFNRLLSESTDRMDEKQDRLKRTLDERLDMLTRQNDQKLEQMRQTVSEKLDGRLSESFSVVNRQLADVHRGLGEMRQLAESVTDLKKLFGNVKTRGMWGEVQLRALLEETLAPGQYVCNAQVEPNTQQRVEFAVRMPASRDEGEALLPIDSKFPQEDFLRLTQAAAAGDAAQAEKCAAQLERALLEQARLISEKYIRPPFTTDYAVMFLPAESLYAEAARRDGLMEKIQTKYRVLVSGPATFAALLTSLRMGFRTCTLEKKSGEVMRLLAEVRQEMGRYDESLDRLRQRLTQAETELDGLDGRSKRLIRRLRDVDGENTAKPGNDSTKRAGQLGDAAQNGRCVRAEEIGE